MDPSKTNRIPNSTLKAFQKNAIQSYFERQQAQQQSIRLSKNAGGGGGSKSDDLSKLKSIVSNGDTKSPPESLKTNGNALRPQSLNLSIAPSPSANMPASSPSSSSASSNSASQRSSLSNWPMSNNSPSSTSMMMIGSKSAAAADVMMKNDVVKMNMKNSAMSSAALNEQQQKQLHVNRGNSKNQSINNKLYTTFCEIKTETYSEQATAAMMENGSIDNLLPTPPPLPKKNGILRR